MRFFSAKPHTHDDAVGAGTEIFNG
jgi:hypothetical protein